MTLLKLKLLITGGLSWIVYSFGGWDLSIQFLLTAIVLDYLAGTIDVIIKKQWDYHTAMVGILKKVSYLILIILGVMIERVLGQGEIIHPILAFFLTVTDGISTAKHLKNIGVPIPDFFMTKLTELESKANGK